MPGPFDPAEKALPSDAATRPDSLNMPPGIQHCPGVRGKRTPAPGQSSHALYCLRHQTPLQVFPVTKVFFIYARIRAVLALKLVDCHRFPALRHSVLRNFFQS